MTFRAWIPAPPTDKARPLWSVMIPTYNCAEYLRQTLRSVLSQDPGRERMQIEVVDDCSTADDPRAVVEEIGRGRVEFYRQPRNLGHVGNFNSCLQRSRGRLVHLLHGDDVVRDGFYGKIADGFRREPAAGAAFCRSRYIDERGHGHSLSPLEQPVNGLLDGWLETIAAGQRVTTPSVVVRREVYERLGGFDRRLSCAGEDWEMWVRIAAHVPVWFEVEPLAAYRVRRAGSLTGDAERSGRMIHDMRIATDIIAEYLPEHIQPEQARRLTKRAHGVYAGWALREARTMLEKGEYGAAFRHGVEALRCSREPRVLRRLVALALSGGVRRAWRTVSLVRRAGDALPEP